MSDEEQDREERIFKIGPLELYGRRRALGKTLMRFIDWMARKLPGGG